MLLGVNLVGGACGVPLYLFLIVGGGYGTETFQSAGLNTTEVWLSFFVMLAALICAWGLWQWKRWGYQGLIVSQLISITLSNTANETNIMLYSMFIGVIWLGLLIWLVNPIEQYLE